MTRAEILLRALELGTQFSKVSPNEPMVIMLLAIRMYEKSLTAALRKNPEATALVAQLWGIVEPMVAESCAKMGLSPGAD